IERMEARRNDAVEGGVRTRDAAGELNRRAVAEPADHRLADEQLVVGRAGQGAEMLAVADVDARPVPGGARAHIAVRADDRYLHQVALEQLAALVPHAQVEMVG